MECAPCNCLVLVALGLGGEADGSGHWLPGSSRKYRTSSRKLLGPLKNKSWAGQGVVQPCNDSHVDYQSQNWKKAWETRG